MESKTSEWDAIASDWDENRTTPSATLAFFKAYAHGPVLDAGCGNGRNSVELARTAAHVIALDASAQMLKKAEKNVRAARTGPNATENVGFVQARIEKMPEVADASMDAVFCLAALHHLPPNGQTKAANELFRVLRPGGHLCLTVWNRQQARFCNKPKELNVPWHGKPRYYYFFDKEELEEKLKQAGFAIELTVFEKDGREALPKDAQNLCIVAKKTLQQRHPVSAKKHGFYCPEPCNHWKK